MNTVEIIILGIIQGLTEFLPISSSGHLVVFKQLLASESFLSGDPIVEVALHVGTLLAVIVYYRKDVLHVFGYFLFRKMEEEQKLETRNLLIWIIIGTVPTVIIGLGFKDWLQSLFDKPMLVGFALCFTGILCLSTRFMRKGPVTLAQLGWGRCVLIGLAQGFAIIPGISRSGSTIVTAMGLGVKPREAGRYSFLLSIPAVAGAAALHLKDVGSLEGISMVGLALGVVASALVGLLCLGILTRLLKAGSFFYFGFYCIPLGMAVVVCFI